MNEKRKNVIYFYLLYLIDDSKENITNILYL
jgi:hypothetical protein